MRNSVKVFAPATVANVTCGFDIFGFALEHPGDELVLRKNDEGIIKVVEITGDNGKLPYDNAKNTATVAIQKLLDHVGSQQGFDVYLHKKMALGSGLGSSAASAVAGVFAANQLLPEPLPHKDLLPFAMEGEKVASGSLHADNVAPCLLGGFILVRNTQPVDAIKIPIPEKLIATVVHPGIVVNTKDARNILKKQIELKQAVEQWGNIGGLVAGMYSSDYNLISRSMKDVIIEPVRSQFIPGFDRAKEAAKLEGALGVGISGSGPAIFALSKERATAESVGTAISDIFKENGIASDIYISPINSQGPVILD